MGIINKDDALYLATGVDTTGLEESKHEVLEILKSLSKEMGETDMFSGMELAAVSAFTRAATGIDVLSRSFEDGMAAVAGISPEIAAGLDSYEQQVIDMTRTIPVAADDCARALHGIVAAGYDGSEAMDVLEIAARRAVEATTGVAEAFSAMMDGGDMSTWKEALSTVDYSGNIAGAEAQLQLLQNNLLAVTRRMGSQVSSQVAEVADRLGKAFSGGSVENGFRSLNTLVALAGSALTDYRQVMEETTYGISAEGTALEISSEIRKAYQEVVAEGVMQRDAEMLQNQIYQEGLARTQLQEGMLGAAQDELIGKSKQLLDMMAQEADRYRQKVMAQRDVVAALQQELGLNEAELAGAEKSVNSKEKLLNMARLGTDARETEIAQTRLLEATELKEAAAIEVSNTKRKLKRAEIQLNTLERRKETAAVVSNALATGTEATVNTVDAGTTGVLTVAKQRLTAATVALGRAMAANPFGLLLTVVSLAISAFSLFGKKTDDVTSSIDKLNEATNKQKEHGNALVNTLYDENEADSKRVEVLLELRKLYPQVWDKVNLANLAEQDRNELIKAGNELLEERRIKELEVQKAESERRLGELKKDVDKGTYTDWSYGMPSQRRTVGATIAEYQYNEEKKKLAEINQELEKRHALEIATKKEAVPREELLERYKTELKDLVGQLEAVRAMRQRLAKDDPRGLAGDAAEYEEQLIGKIKSKEKDIKLLDPKKELTKEERENLKKDINRDQDAQNLKLEKETQDKSLAQAVEGREKRITEMRIEYKERGRLIDKEEKALQDKYAKLGEAMPANIAQVFENRKELNNKNLQDAIKQIDEQNQQEVKQHQEVLARQIGGNYVATDEERKREEIKNKYKGEKTWAKNQKANNGMSAEEMKNYIKDVNLAEKNEQLNRLKAELNDFDQREKAIEAEWEAKKQTAEKSGGDDALIQKIEEEKKKAVSALNAEEIIASDDWNNLFTNLDDLTIGQIDELMGNIQANIDSKKLELNPVELKQLTGKLKEAQQKIATLNPFRAMGDSMKKVFAGGADEAGKSSKEIEDEWKDLGTSTKGCFDFINDAVGNCSVLSDALGESGQQTMGMIQGVATAGITMATAMKSVEKGSVVLAVIGAALTAVTALSSLFNKDKKQEKKIKGLQQEIDKLERAYDKLGTAIDNTYTEDVYRMMDEQNEKLREQQVLIQQQIEAEGKKKKKDKGKIRDWKNEIEDIDQKIEENKRKQIESLAGTDVQSAINDFADALTEAYAKGESGAKALGDTTKKVMANAVKEALKKKFLGESIQSAVNYLGESMKDGVLSKSEQEEFTRMVEEGGENYTKAMEAYGNLFKDAYDDAREGVSGQLQAAMTEGTASELVGLWNSTAMDVRVIRDWLLTGTDVSVQQPGFNMNELLEQQYRIEENTRMTVYRLQEGFGRMGQQLDAIERNTRGYGGRGR